MAKHFLMVTGCLLLAWYGRAQSMVSGKIFAAGSDSVLAFASVQNKNSRAASRSGQDGRYSIRAQEGDTLIFSATGYEPDTIGVAFHMLQLPYDVTLRNQALILQKVTVTARTYQSDSLDRRAYYRHILDKRFIGITGGNTPSGFGISLSPFSFFSKESKQRRQLKKRLAKYEEESFIDYSFPPAWVQRITGLQGDSLRLFLYRYRPSYAFCRKTDELGMIVYVNAKLKEFRKPRPLPAP